MTLLSNLINTGLEIFFDIKGNNKQTILNDRKKKLFNLLINIIFNHLTVNLLKCLNNIIKIMYAD